MCDRDELTLTILSCFIHFVISWSQKFKIIVIQYQVLSQHALLSVDNPDVTLHGRGHRSGTQT